MGLKFISRIILSVSTVLFAVLSCSRETQTGDSPFDKADSYYSVYKSLVYTDSDSVIRLIRVKQSETEDSTLWYYWESLIARSHYLGYHDDSSLISCAKISGFCNRNSDENSNHLDQIRYLNAINLNMTGILKQSIGQRDSALSCYTKSFQILSHIPYRKEISNITINAGDVTRQMGRFTEAITWLRRSLFLSDSLGQESQMNAICISLGQIYTDIRNFTMAHKYLGMADSIYVTNNEYESFNLYNSIGNCYYFEKEYEEALESFWKAYSIVKKLQNPTWKAIVEANIGECHLYLDHLDSAKLYIDSAYGFFSSSPNPDEGCLFYTTGLKAGLALAQDNYSEASYYLERPFDQKAIGAIYLHTYYKRLRDLHEKKGDFKNAVKYARIVGRYEDSLRNIQQINNITEIESRYIRDTAFLHKNLVIANNQQKIEKQKNILLTLIILSILVLSAGIGGTWFFRRQRAKDLKQQAEKMNLLRIENAQKLLSPHFIFNVLNSLIPSLREDETLGKSLSLLIKVLRTNIMISGKISIPLEDELSLAQDYAKLRCSISSNPPKVVWNISKSVDRKHLLPTMIIQNNVENALKHAFPPSFSCPDPEGKKIGITIDTPTDSSLHIIIKDNGIGFKQSVKTSSSSPSSGTGKGIMILMKTIEILNTKNNEKIIFEITEDHGTTVDIIIPDHYNYKI